MARWALLIYKSIRDAISYLEGRELFCLAPILAGEETPRTVFVSKELGQAVVPQTRGWAATRDGRLFAHARGVLDAFTEGDFITMALDPFDKDARAIIARVDPIGDGVCDFRCLDPKPGIRIFGCFSEPDTFIALTWDYRENLENGARWASEVERCKKDWTKLFGTLRPLIGKTVNEYVSYNVRAV